MSFQVPYDPSPPSTPEKSRSFLSNVSTTPAGAPPSKANSFTPVGPPPSTVFGSSQLGSRTKNSPDSLFTKSGHMNANDSIFGSSFGSFNPGASRSKPFATRSPFGVSNGTRFGESTNFGNDSFASQTNETTEEDAEETVSEHEADDDMDAEETNGESTNRFSFLDSNLGDSLPPRPTTALGQTTALGHRKSIFSSPASAKRPKLDERRANQPPLRKAKLSPKKDSPMRTIVKNFASRSRLAAVEEPNEMVTQTEDEICRMYDNYSQPGGEGDDVDLTFSEAANNLAAIWHSRTQSGSSQAYGTEAAIGPGDHAPNVAKAAFLGSLILQLHHPPAKENLSASGSRSLILSGPRTYSATPMPKVLLDWLETNHIPQSADLLALRELEPNPTASSNFWEIINSGVLRGCFADVTEILRSADFNYARSALEDGLPQNGYRGIQLQNIQRCINKLLQNLESCPGSQGNWDVRGPEWSMYRKRIVSAVADLEEFAEGEELPTDTSTSGNRFQAVNFGLSTSGQQNLSFTQSARMAESRVPWAIYQNVKSIYRIILGDVDAIASHAQDWVEATVGLTVWWDGEDDDVQFDGSKSQITLDDPRNAYLRRITLAYSNATGGGDDDGSFRLNSLSSLEVGLASVFEGNVEGVVELLQTWSLCVASAVAEVSSAAGWFEPSEKAPGLNEDDLMVLSYGQGNLPGGIRKDDVLGAYASGLSERPWIDSQPGGRSGWEVALGILSRLDDTERMQRSVSELLDKLPLDTSSQMDKVVLLCGELGLEDEGRRVAEVCLSVIFYAITDCSAIRRCYCEQVGGLRPCTSVLCSGT